MFTETNIAKEKESEPVSYEEANTSVLPVYKYTSSKPIYWKHIMNE